MLIQQVPPDQPAAARSLTVVLLWWLIAMTSLAMAGYAFSYLIFGDRMYPRELLESFRTRPWGIYSHAFFGVLGIGLGPFQFRRQTLRLKPHRHRLLGKIYLISALMVGLSGIYMALYSYGGATTHLGFGFMGAGLLITTGVAYSRIRRRRIALHREWMIRSFSLMFSAVTFRIWLGSLSISFGEFDPAYLWASWISWLPNLVVAEWYIRYSRRSLPNRGRQEDVIETLGTPTA